MRTLLAWPALLLAGGLTVLPPPASASGPGEEVALDHPMLGEAAPEFRLTGLDGEELALSDLRGSFIVLHFGASW